MPNNVAQNEEEQNQQNPEEELNHQNSNGDEENEAMEDGVSSEVNEGNCCPICMHPWSSEGAHRICCLPCGHVYGLSCAEKWLQKSSGNGKCPQCNRKCSVKNILRLYASHIPVSNEHKEKILSLQADNDALTMQYGQITLQLQSMTTKIMDRIQDLKQDIESIKSQKILSPQTNNKALKMQYGQIVLQLHSMSIKIMDKIQDLKQDIESIKSRVSHVSRTLLRNGVPTEHKGPYGDVLSYLDMVIDRGTELMGRQYLQADEP